MLLCGMGSSKGFHNWIAYHHRYCLCDELPIYLALPYPDYPIPIPYYNEHSNDYESAFCTRIFRLLFATLAQQQYRGMPIYTSIQDSRTRIVALMQEMSRDMLSGRIGAWVSLELSGEYGHGCPMATQCGAS